jgi:gluconolactonase
MAELQVLDASFERLIDPRAPIENIATGFTFTEGPVWHGQDRRLLFPPLGGGRLGWG